MRPTEHQWIAIYKSMNAEQQARLDALVRRFNQTNARPTPKVAKR